MKAEEKSKRIIIWF